MLKVFTIFLRHSSLNCSSLNNSSWMSSFTPVSSFKPVKSLKTFLLRGILENQKKHQFKKKIPKSCPLEDRRTTEEGELALWVFGLSPFYSPFHGVPVRGDGKTFWSKPLCRIQSDLGWVKKVEKSKKSNHRLKFFLTVITFQLISKSLQIFVPLSYHLLVFFNFHFSYSP